MNRNNILIILLLVIIICNLNMCSYMLTYKEPFTTYLRQSVRPHLRTLRNNNITAYNHVNNACNYIGFN